MRLQRPQAGPQDRRRPHWGAVQSLCWHKTLMICHGWHNAGPQEKPQTGLAEHKEQVCPRPKANCFGKVQSGELC